MARQGTVRTDRGTVGHRTRRELFDPGANLSGKELLERFTYHVPGSPNEFLDNADGTCTLVSGSVELQVSFAELEAYVWHRRAYHDQELRLQESARSSRRPRRRR